MKITIRTPYPGDVAQLVELSGQLGYPSSAGEISQRLEQIHAEKGHLVLVAADETEAAVGWIHGHVVQWLESAPFVEVGGMVVAESCRGQGVGARLLGEVESWAKSCGFKRIRVRSNVVRERAHGFYIRAGYDKVKTSYVFEKNLE